MIKIQLFIILILFFVIDTAFSATKPKTDKSTALDLKTLNKHTKKNPFVPQIPVKPPEPPKDEIQVKKRIDPPENNKKSNQKDKSAKPPTPPQLTITGVVWDTNKPQAIINGKVVNPGDLIEGAKIVSIKKTGIDVIFNEIKFTLKP